MKRSQPQYFTDKQWKDHVDENYSNPFDKCMEKAMLFIWRLFWIVVALVVLFIGSLLIIGFRDLKFIWE